MAELTQIEQSIMDDIDRLDDTLKVTDSVRSSVMTKLQTVVSEMKIDPDSEKPTVILAKTALIDTLLKAADTLHSSKENIVKLKQKVRSGDDDTNELASEIVSTFLATMQLANDKNSEDTSFDNVVSSTDEVLDAVVAEQGIVSSQGETTIAEPSVDI